MKQILKYLIFCIFLIISKSEIEYGSCIENKRQVKLEDGSIKSLECIPCVKDSFSNYKNDKLECEKCPENYYNYGNDIVINIFSKKILTRHSFTFNIECNDKDKSLCPKWENNYFSLKVENAKDDIDSKAILKMKQYYMKKGKFQIKYINYNGDINRYLLIYINNILVYKDDSKHSKEKIREFDITEGYNDIEIQYIIDKNLSPKDNDIESFLEIYEIQMLNAETSSLECRMKEDINFDMLKKTKMNNCDFYINKCSDKDYCTFRYYTEISDGNFIQKGSQVISYSRITGGKCAELLNPLTKKEIEAEQCSYGQYRNVRNDKYTCDNCDENTFNNKIINYNSTCEGLCPEDKIKKMVLYIKNFTDQSESDFNFKIIAELGYVEINYEKFNLREDSVIFILIEDIDSINKTYELINPNGEFEINNGKFKFKIPLKKGEYNFLIKGKNLKLKTIKIFNTNEGGNYLCSSELKPENETNCPNKEYYSSNEKSCKKCPMGTNMTDNNLQCAFTEQIINDKFILDNTLLLKDKLFLKNIIIEKDPSQYHLFLNPSFPLIYLTNTINTINTQIIGNELHQMQLIRGVNNRGYILTYIHKQDGENGDIYYSNVYFKCSKNEEEKIEFKGEDKDSTGKIKYYYFQVLSKNSCPYCLKDETTETKTDGICHKNSTELYNITPKDDSECVIKPYDNISNSQIIIDNNNSTLFLFYNSSKDSDQKLINKFQINEDIPLFYEDEGDKIVTEDKIYKHCDYKEETPDNGENGSLGTVYIVLIAIGSVIIIAVIVLIVWKMVKNKKLKDEEEEMCGDDGDRKELNIKSTSTDI